MDYVFTPFNKENMIQALNIMWKGMLAIFIVITIIAVVSFLINIIFNKIEQNKSIKNNYDDDDLN